MRTVAMDEDRLVELLDRYGGDPRRWPADARGPAEVLLAVSARARALMAEMAAVETGLRALAAERVETTPAEGGGAMAARAMRHPQVGLAPRVLRRAGWGALAVLVLAVGLVVGSARTEGSDEAPAQVVASALAPAGAGDVD